MVVKFPTVDAIFFAIVGLTHVAQSQLSYGHRDWPAGTFPNPFLFPPVVQHLPPPDIVCAGHYPYEFGSPLPLASFCASTLSVECGTDLYEIGPKHLTFTKLYEETPSDWSHDLDYMTTRMRMFRRVRRWSEICYNKCRCLHPPPGPLRQPPGPRRQVRVYEIDFDTRTPRYIRALPFTRQYPMYAFDQGGSTRARFFTGHPGQAPTCSEDPIANPIVFQAQWNLGDQYPVYDTIASLCLHRYYGGSAAHNFGGVCIRTTNFGLQPEEIRLEFLYELISPYFTTEYPRPAGAPEALQQFHFTQTLAAYCQTECSCKTIQEYDALEAATIQRQVDLGRKGGTQRKHGMLTRGSAKRKKEEDALNEAYLELEGFGETCQSAAECSNGLVCEFQSQTVDSTNRQSISFTGICVILASSMIRGSGRGMSKLNPRSANTPKETYCLCNSTYVSENCCVGYNEMVWEEPRMQPAELHRILPEEK